MKKIIVILVVIILPFTTFSQETTLDKIAKETCEYLQSDEVKNSESSIKTEKLGLFIIGLYSKYEQELISEGLEINFSGGNDGGREFGEKVGINMVKFCPEVLMALAESEMEEEIQAFYVEGELQEITGVEFSTVVLKDNEGKIQKFLWLENFKGSNKLIESESVKGIKVRLGYKNVECYSPQLKDYIIRKEILEIDFVE